MFKNQKGITLIALVITIIVLLILAGITIALITNNDSAPNKAAEAKIIQDVGAAKDAININAAELMANYYNAKYVNNDKNYTTSPFTYITDSHITTSLTTGLFKNLSNATITDYSASEGTFIVQSTATKSEGGKQYYYVQKGTVQPGGTIKWENPADSAAADQGKSNSIKDSWRQV